MKEDIISFSDEDFARLKKLIDSREYGFPVLAMHSLAEREIAKANGYDYSKDNIGFTFADLCRMLSLEGKQKKIVDKLISDRNEYVNHIRHGFMNLTPTDASMIENRFFDFVHAFNPAAEKLKEYMEVKNSVEHALKDKKMITLSEDKYNELMQTYPELISTRANLEEALKRYNSEHAKVEELNHKLIDSEDEYKANIKIINDNYDKKRREFFNSQQDSKKKLEEMKKLREEEARELKELQSKHDMEIAKLLAERDGYLAEIEKSRSIVDAYDFASQYYAYSEGRRSYIRSIMNLSRQQKEIVNSVSLNSDFLVRGGAGSGKTLVLLKLNERLRDGKEHTCRFLTYTNTLSYFSKVIMPELENDKRLDVRTITSLLSKMTWEIFKRNFIFKDEEMAELTDTLRENPDYVQEIKLFIWAKNVDKATYLGGCERRGMKEGVDVEERQKIWTALEELESVLKMKGTGWPVEYAVVRHLAEYEKNPALYNEFRRDYTLVDEFQDLSPLTLSLLKKISNVAIYLAGDASQSIFKKAHYTLKEIGINIEGRTRILDQCFRSTRQINDVCRQYKEVADVKTEGKEAPEEDVVNIRSGLPVSLQVFENSDECQNNLLGDLKALQTNIKVPLKDICVIVYTKEQRDRVQALLKENGIKTVAIDTDKLKSGELEAEENNVFESDSVKIMTIYSAKGLEFPCVLFYGKEEVIGEKGISKQSYEKLKKDLVYVALTRACSILHIFYDRSTKSDALDLLDQEINQKAESVEANDNSADDIPF